MKCPKCKEQSVFVETIVNSKNFSIEDLTEEELKEKFKEETMKLMTGLILQ